MSSPTSAYPRSPEAEAGSSMVPAELAATLWRRKWLLVLSLILCVSAGAAYVAVAPRTYLVTARLLVQRQGMPTEPDKEHSTSGGFLATQAEIIRSPTVLEPVVKALNLAARDPAQPDPIYEILKTLVVKPMNPTSVLSISYRTSDAELTTRTVQAIIEQYRSYLRQSEQGAQLESLHLLAEYEKSLRQELDVQEKKYDALRKARPPALPATPGDTQRNPAGQLAQLAQLSQMVAAAQIRRNAIENMVQPTVHSPALERARAEEQNLLQLYREEYERVLTPAGEKPGDPRSADEYVLKEQQAQGAIQRVQGMHSSVVSQMRQLKLAEQALAAGRLRVAVNVLEAPSVAQPQVFPPPMILLGMCVFAGLGSGAGLAILLERLKAAIRTVAQVQDQLGLPVVGSIPVIEIPRPMRDAELHRSRRVCQAPESAVAEAFRTLRTRLIYAFPSDRGWVVQLASPVDGEGKTTVAANLACSFAQLGKHVVLLDADFRRGRHHQLFDVPGRIGLSSVLRDGVAVEKAVVRSPLAPVDVLPRGPAVANPVELLAQPEFEAVLQRLRQAYDVVLMDGPPVLMDTGALVLAAKADEVLLCLRAGHSAMGETVRACGLLEELNKRPWGAIISELQSRRRYEGYYAAGPAEHGPPAATEAAPRAAGEIPEREVVANGRVSWPN